MHFITLINLKRFLANLLSKNLVFKKSLTIAPNMYDDPGGITKIGSFTPIPSSPSLQVPQLTIQSCNYDKGDLGGVFYRGDEIATKRYANAAVENETKNWKDAYNALRKRSYPTAFDDDELTLIMNAPTDNNSGSFTLSRPYSNFNGLLFDVTNSAGAFERIYVSSGEIKSKIDIADDFGHIIFLFSHSTYCACQIRNPLEEQFFSIHEMNCIIQRIYGVKFKEIT